MSIGELSFESPPSLSVTWSIPDFFRLATESHYTLRSPDITFADGRYYLRLFPYRDFDDDWIGIELLNSIDTDPGRAVLYEVELKSGTREIDWYCYVNNKKVFRLPRSYLEDERDVYVPDGNLTVLCFVRSREPSSGGSPKSGGAQTPVIPQYRMTGKLSSELFPFLYVMWKIPAFFQLTRDSRYTLESPDFLFADRRYRLRLYPFECGVEIHLVNLSDPVPGRYVSFEVGLKPTTGEEIDIERYGLPPPGKFYILRAELDDMQPMRFPDCLLTVFCSMRSREPSSGGSPKSIGAETSGSKAPAPQAAAHPKSSGAETSNEEGDKDMPGISKLSSDLRQLLQKMPSSDACLVVSGKEFRAHQIILRARSKVFDAKFGHETAESESGRVVIDDLDPDSFDDFLEYVYTGIIRAGLSDDNTFGLYKAADKYDLPTLKAECMAHMRSSLSVDSFCDVLAVALRHSEEELLSQAVLFFKENMAQIIVTAKWKQFTIDNGASANEMFIKACVPPGQ